MMPENDLSKSVEAEQSVTAEQPSIAERPIPAEGSAASAMRPTTVSTKPTLQDLFTGGWKRPLSGLPTALGRPLTHWVAAGRSRLDKIGHQAPGGTVPR